MSPQQSNGPAAPPDGGALLEMSGISKSFAGIPALIGANLAVDRAEVMALVGQNGAGKSTMIKILNGAVIHDSGTLSFDGKPWSASSPQQAQRGGISTIFQEINLIGYRSVAENIALGREPRRFGAFLDWARINDGARDLLARFDVHVDVRRPLSEFSTAIQQMVAIARALSFEAKLVIMDEPTSSLDQSEVDVLMRTVLQLKSHGVSVIYVSHKLEELYRICDRVTVMRDGRTVAVAPMASMSKLELVASMLGRDLAEVSKRGATAFVHGTAKSGAPLLDVAGLSIGRRVHNAKISIRTGEIVGLAGLLGSGRTETARAVFAADRRAAGEVTIEGKPTQFKSPREAIAAGIGFCSEDRKVEGIVPGMSIADNLTLALLPALQRSGIFDTVRQAEIVKRFIAEIGIKCRDPGQPIRELSGGNQQKVLLARWLAMNPKLLILDEPTRGIDVGAKAEIQSLIGRLASDGLGVMMISSELEEIVEGAERVFVLREGVTVAELTGSEISEGKVMAAMAEGQQHAEVAHV